MIKSIYGKIKLNKHICPLCGNSILNNDSFFSCDVCNYSNEDEEAKTFEIIVPPSGIRKIPSRDIQGKLLEIQNNKCYWCANKFGTPYWKNNKIRFLRIHWDHKIPFSYEKANRDDNWVASCNICNLFKSNFLFKTDKECRMFLLKKWEILINKNEISF